MFNNLYSGIRFYGEAFSLLFSRFWVYLIYPVILSLLIYWLGWSWIDRLIEFLNGYMSTFKWPDSFAWLEKVISFFISVTVNILFFVLFVVFQKYVVLIFMSPVLALLSENVEEVKTGKRNPFVIEQFLKDILRGIIISIRNFFLETLLLLAGFILSLIPFVGFLFPLFSLLVSSYFWGFSVIDYSNERSRMTIKESTNFILKNKYAVIGIGLIFYLLFMIPVVGFIIAPLVSCIASTLFVLGVREV